MLKGFKDFLLRGNVVDLAVAVVIGTAFGTLVKAFTDNIITPIISVVGGTSSQGLAFQIIGSNAATRVDVGAVISAIIYFVIVAAVIYFVIVVPMNTIKERRRAGVEAGPAEPTDVELLSEIRDLLRGQQKQV